MARNFLDQEEEKTTQRLSYTDGFRFGFGFFIANLIGVTILSALVMAVSYGVQQLR